MNKLYEHMNIIETLGNQIESLLDLMQCASSECTAIRSVNTASEMCLTMFDELTTEIDQIKEDRREYQKVVEEVKENMCDHYCRYTHGEEVTEEICALCPLEKLGKG